MSFRVCHHHLLGGVLLLLAFQLGPLKTAGASPGNVDSLKEVLNKVLAEKTQFDQQKLRSISLLKQKLQSGYASPDARYTCYEQLFDAYKSFIYDSAYAYCKRLNACANLLKDKNKINHAKVNTAFALISAGMFKEGIDTLRTIAPQYLDKKQKFQFFMLQARSSFDLVDFDEIEDYRKIYIADGLKYCDSIICNYPVDSYEYLCGYSLKLLRSKQYAAAIDSYTRLLKMRESYMDSAVNFSCLSYLYFSMHQPQTGLAYRIKSAIIDNTHSTKESLALIILAEYIYKTGDTKTAFIYINNALEDNNFYGAKQRKVRISNILPIIEKERVQDVENQRRSLLIYASIITCLIILVVVFAIITLKQLRKLRIADKLITEKNNGLNERNTLLLDINDSLNHANQSLTLTNKKLDEANIIKEEYIGYFFNVHADYIEKMDRLRCSLEKITVSKAYRELQTVLQRLNTNFERENFYHSFDEVFLKLFPNFVEDFNALFDAHHQTHLPAGQLLNKELRIFALIRLGIVENETIAKILDYSVNTIYAYKTKVKNRSFIPNNEFEERIQRIRAVKEQLPLSL